MDKNIFSLNKTKKNRILSTFFKNILFFLFKRQKSSFKQWKSRHISIITLEFMIGLTNSVNWKCYERKNLRYGGLLEPVHSFE